MDTKQIDNFIVLYETRNMHRAAERLYISQQGLSRSLQALETELGIMLFERSHAGMTPTTAGEYFYERIRAIRSELDELRQNLQIVASGGTQVELPCSYGILHSALPTVSRFVEAHPNIQLRWEELTDREVERRLLDGRCDLGLCVRNQDPTGLEFVPLFTRRKVLLVPEEHRLANVEAVEYGMLQNERIALEGPEFNANKRFVQGCVETGFYPTVVAETAEITLCLKLAAEGRALSVVPDFIARLGASQGVVAVPFADESFVWEAGAVYRKGHRPSGTFGTLLNYLVEHAHEME